MALPSCTLDRSGLVSPATWSVEPALFCPGDPVTVSWNFARLPRHPDNCRPRNGGYSSTIACTSSSGCPADPAGRCLDGFCCANSVPSGRCPTGDGCIAPFNVTITADTLSLDPPVDSESDDVRGTRTVHPSETTVFTIRGDWVNPVTLFEETRTATRITAIPETPLPVHFGFACSGATPGYRFVDFNANPPATENARVGSVRNPTGHTIRVTGGDPTRGPITLRPGEATDGFNGPVRGVWSVALDPTDAAALRVPRCSPDRGAENPWPDLRIELVLVCAAP
ncbi:MAG TPA: hypothetical protein VEA16_06980 [Vicinamibacterales bacterium]|nr:hypothetical protein [Vicinamibacterales bacterium]